MRMVSSSRSLIDMFPRFAVFDAPNGEFAHFELFGNVSNPSAAGKERTNFSHVVFSEFCAGMV